MISRTSVLSVLLVAQVLLNLTSQVALSHHTLISPNKTPLELKDPLIWDTNSLYKSSLRGSKSISQRTKRSTKTTAETTQSNNLVVVDACQSKMEILTPYYATNSKGKLRTIVNSELMQQAIQVETCLRSPSPGNQSGAKCNVQLDCGCEQKYKWHRLLVHEPKNSNSAKGLFMDWFLFPSSCVCRCKNSPTAGAISGRQFLRAINS